MFCCLLKILDNTFIGTLLAGIILASYGVYLYRKQKNIDNEYEDHRKIKELAASLFAHIETSLKDFHERLTIFSPEGSQLELMYDHINKESGNYFKDESDRKINLYTNEINKALNDLAAYLKTVSDSYDAEIQKLVTEIPFYNMYLLSNSVLHMHNKELLDKIKTGIDEKAKIIQDTLLGIMKK